MTFGFDQLGLSDDLVQVVSQMGFEEPTPIQSAAIPVLLTGQDVIGQAQTGTGKTAAFILPMLQSIIQGERIEPEGIHGLVLAPTRELAIQVASAASALARGSNLRVLPVYGGQSYTVQTRQLQRGVDIVVGTPGRLLDLMRQGALDLSAVRFMVVDEADEMLEMGFIEDVETILAETPEERQVALFSATMPIAIRRLAERYQKNPHTISITPEKRTVAGIEQRYCWVKEDDKLDALVRVLNVEEVTSALIFTRTKARAQDLADELFQQGFSAEALHGDLNQARRELVLNHFRRGSTTLLIATDVAARGLDIDNVSHVFNFDYPHDEEAYIHRIGRTGRAGRTGTAVTFLTPRERRRPAQIEAFSGQPIKPFNIPTRAEMAARRDDRLANRLAEALQSDPEAVAEDTIIRLLREKGLRMNDIAAAALKLLRAGEPALPERDLIAPVMEKQRPAKTAAAPRENFAAPVAAKKKGGKIDKNPARQLTVDLDRLQDERMIRLRMNLGSAHGLRPSDVVGAIASETSIPGKAIGDIEIHRDFTFVHIARPLVKRVLKASTGQYSVRGKPVMMTLAY